MRENSLLSCISANPEGYNALGLAVSRASIQVIQLILNTVKIDNAGLFIGNVITLDVSNVDVNVLNVGANIALTSRCFISP